MGCLVEDDLLEATHGGRLEQSPEIEAHIASCPACSAVVAALVAGEREAGPARDRWGALVGKTFGAYRLESQIGAGAMGDVYRGRDERLGRPVAVKILTAADGAALALEGRAAAAIVHPNVVTVYDVGSADGRAFVVSELIDGESLRSMLESGRLKREQALRLGIELARGLAAAHAAGVVHRDLKPENLLVARDGTLKILDFGLAKLAGHPAGLDDTEPGAVRGTVGYMAPEQARGEPVDERADLFAAGAILHELCTGQRAFPGASHAERLSAVLRDSPAGLDDPELGPLGPIIARCLEKDPAARFHSAHDLAWVLEEVAGGTFTAAGTTAAPSRARVSRRGLLIGGAAAAATGVIGAIAGRRARRAGPTAKPPSLRQLTFRQGRVVTARFSRDGAGVFFGGAWEGEPLAVSSLRLDGGVARALDLPSADVLAVSATSLAIGIDRRHVDGQCATGRLALAPIDGGAPRVMRDDVQDADLAADGSELALVVRAGRGFQLEWPLGRVVLSTAEWITNPRIARDGRRVACLLHPGTNDDQGRVAVIERAGGAPRTVSDGWSSVAGLAWSPAGDRLLVSGGRTGATSVIHAFAPGGEHEVLFETAGRMRLHDVTASGQMLISQDAWRLRTVAGGGGGPDVDRSLTAVSLVSDLSPDGRSLVVGEFGEVDAVNGVYVVPTDGDGRLRLGPGWPLARSPDQSRVLATTFSRMGGAPSTILYSTSGGAATPLPIEPALIPTWARWIDDGHLVLQGAALGRPERLWRIARAGGSAQPLTAEGVYGLGIPDPPGHQVAFVDRQDRLSVISLADNALRAVPGSYRDQVACGWQPDGGLLVRTTTTPIQIRRIDPATGAATPVLELTPPPLGLRGVDAVLLDATAQRYAYSYGQELSQLLLLSLPTA